MTTPPVPEPTPEPPSDRACAAEPGGGAANDKTGPAHEPADADPTADRVLELATQLEHLQIQTYGVLQQLSAIAGRLTTVEDRSEDIGAALDAIESVLATTTPQSPADTAADTAHAGGGDGGGGLDLRRLVAWVRDCIAVLLERKMPQTQGGMHWCRQWWQHAEAIARFEALRRCHAEAITADEGSGMAVFYEHLDHHLAVLTSETGPFAFCARGTHALGRATPLGHDEPSERYFLDFDAIRAAQDADVIYADLNAATTTGITADTDALVS